MAPFKLPWLNSLSELVPSPLFRAIASHHARTHACLLKRQGSSKPESIKSCIVRYVHRIEKMRNENENRMSLLL